MQRAMIGAADELRLMIEGADRGALPGIARLLWAAVAAGSVSDAEAESLDALLRSRTSPPGASRTGAVQVGVCRSLFPPKRRQRAPERAVMIERRRATAASGWLPPAIAARFTVSEQSVLAVVLREIATKGSCELAVDSVAALAGCSRRLVQGVLRLAHDTGIILIEERRRHGQRNATNRITLLSREVVAWVKRRAGGGCRNAHPMSTQGQNEGRQRVAGPELGLIEGRERSGRGSLLGGRSHFRDKA